MTTEQEYATTCARDIATRRDVVPWRHIERMICLRMQGLTCDGVPLCPKDEHTCEWDDDDGVLRCTKCGLNCT